jgi:prepilin-type N-terminal cleavage/methylation domain-containing protein
MRKSIMPNRRGFTLVELLIAITVFMIVLAAAMQGLSYQSRGFNRGTDEMGILQNLRYGAEQLDQDLRMAGANAPDRQPSVVYAGPNSFSYNADITSNVVGDISAVYVDPDANAGEVSAFALAAATIIPASSPAFTYPQVEFAPSAAETVIYWFSADLETSRGDDFVLNRRVNTRADEVLMRGVLAPTGGNFFKYYYLNAPVGVAATVDSLPTAWGQLRHSAPLHGQLPDTGITARIDLLRAVEVKFRVTNNRPGTAERIRSISATIPLPNVGVKKLQTCGDAPIFTSAIAAAVTGGPPPFVVVTWNASVDEATGEQDIIRYVLWRRIVGVASWGDPYSSIPSGAPPYSFTDSDVISGTSYEYSVSAQDCTPLLSTKRLSGQAVIP